MGFDALTPKQLKDLLVTAWTSKDKDLAWQAVEEIVTRDMYINVPTGGWTNQPRMVTVQWGKKPCQGRCNLMVEEGVHAVWVKGTGVWHPECWLGDLPA